MHSRHLESIQAFEGFTRQAKWDYAQFTNGFGTKALHPGEQITVEEARRRFAAEIEQARAFVEKHAAGWDEGTKAALTSLTFNAGTKWATSGLGEAVRDHDIEAVRSRFLTYTRAGGEELPGLVRRRLAEVTWIGEADHRRTPAPPAAGSIRADATATTADTIRAASGQAMAIPGGSTLGERVVRNGEPGPMAPDGLGFSVITDTGGATPAASLSAVAWWLALLDPHARSGERGDERDPAPRRDVPARTGIDNV